MALVVKEERKLLSVKVPEPLYRKLKLLSAKTDKPMMYIALEALKKYLDELESKEEEVKE